MTEQPPTYRPTDFSTGERLARLTGIIHRGSKLYDPQQVSPIEQLGGYAECRRIIADAIARGQIKPADKTPQGGMPHQKPVSWQNQNTDCVP